MDAEESATKALDSWHWKAKADGYQVAAFRDGFKAGLAAASAERHVALDRRIQQLESLIRFAAARRELIPVAALLVGSRPPMTEEIARGTELEPQARARRGADTCG